MKTILCPLFAILVCLLPSCSNMTPEQKAGWNTTGQALVKDASTIALDEARIRLRDSRKTADNKSTVNDGP